MVEVAPVDVPLGAELDWKGAGRPTDAPLRGSHVLLRAIEPSADAEPLYEASRDPSLWTYLPDGPYEDPGQLRAMLVAARRSQA